MSARKIFGTSVLALFLAAGCSRSSDEPADLASAVAVVGYLASPRYIERSMYSATAESGSPSEFVSYLFSTMGAAERPESAKVGATGDGSRGGPPTWPEGIGFYAHKPDVRGGRQVVVIPDDARGVVVAEGYASPSTKPLVRREFALAKPKKLR